MNDYCKGAIEALFWVKTLADKKMPAEVMAMEVNKALNDLYGGLAIDFRDRLSRGIR